MTARPRVVELSSVQSSVFEEYIVDDAVLPVGRFVKKGTAAGTVTIAAQGERCVGVSVESPIPTVSNRTSDFADYADGDTCVVCKASERYVYIEAESQVLASIDHDDLVTSGANGKAEVAASGDFVHGHSPTLVTYDGVLYIRFLPDFLNSEAVA